VGQGVVPRRMASRHGPASSGVLLGRRRGSDPRRWPSIGVGANGNGPRLAVKASADRAAHLNNEFATSQIPNPTQTNSPFVTGPPTTTAHVVRASRGSK